MRGGRDRQTHVGEGRQGENEKRRDEEDTGKRGKNEMREEK